MKNRENFENLSLMEVAEIFGFSVQGFKDRLARAGYAVERFRTERGYYQIPLEVFRSFLKNPDLPKYPPTAIFLGNNKGGVGKTTVNLLLALVLGPILGFKVVLIDLDHQTFSMSKCVLGAENLDTLEAFFPDALERPELWEKALAEAPWENIWIIPSRAFKPQWETALSVLPNVVKLVKNLKSRFNFILMDPPPAKTDITDAAIYAADAVVGITLPHYLSFSQLGDIFFSIRQANSLRGAMGGEEGGQLPPVVFPGIIVNAFSKRHKVDRISMELLEVLWEDPFYQSQRPEFSHDRPVLHPPIPKLTLYKELPLLVREIPPQGLLSRASEAARLTLNLLKRIRTLQRRVK